MIIGIIFLILGIYLFINFLKNGSENKVKYFFAAVLFFSIGVIVLGLKFFGYENLLAGTILIAVGCSALLMAVYDIMLLVKCNFAVEGECLGEKAKAVARSATRYQPKFIYEVCGRTYKSTSIDDFSKRYVSRKYQKGKKYYIYVDPKNPEKFVCRRMISADDILILIAAIILIVIGYVYLI